MDLPAASSIQAQPCSAWLDIISDLGIEDVDDDLIIGLGEHLDECEGCREMFFEWRDAQDEALCELGHKRARLAESRRSGSSLSDLSRERPPFFDLGDLPTASPADPPST